MKHLLVTAFAAFVLTIAGPLCAATIYVDDNAPNDPGPGDPAISDPLENGTADHPYDAIQEGIDAATAGDTVLVADGTYTGPGNRDLDYHGKAITVTSQNGPDVTIIDCQGTEAHNHRGFYLHSGETSAATIQGLTVQNGYVEDLNGGGICVENSDPTIMDCTITQNAASLNGGGIYLSNADDAQIINCTITLNTTGQRGAGIYLLSSDLEIRGCVIANNEDGTYSAGAVCIEAGSPSVVGCTLVRNKTSNGGAICCRGGSTPTVAACILWDNVPGEIDIFSGTPVVSYCDIKGGWSGTGNIDADPFLMPGWHLRNDSPCIDQSPTGPPDDFDGEDRPFPSSGSYDIGADEFVDTDGDGLPDYWETAYGLDPNDDGSVDPNNGASGDPDSDTLSNVDEYLLLTNPHLADTDGDGRDDAQEVTDNTNPIHPDNALRTYYVNGTTGDDAYDGLAPAWDGTHGPKQTIQAGIDATVDGWDYTVLVADGTYTGDGNRDLDYEGKAIRVQSEHGPASTTIDCGGTTAQPHRAFFFHSEETNAAVVDGFTIRNGVAVQTEPFTGFGGAIRCETSSPSITDCVVVDCSARKGGAVGCSNASCPSVSNCRFEGNRASDEGGAVACWNSSAVNITDSSICGNTSGDGGGGMAFLASIATVTRVTLVGNSTSGYGGAVWTRSSRDLVIEDALVIANHSVGNGGGIYLRCDSSPVSTNLRLVHSTLARNTSTEGDDGIHFFSKYYTAEISGSILWGNGTHEIGGSSYYVSLSYSIIQGGWTGTGSGNVDVDPFLRPDGHLGIGSPAIDMRATGGPSTDIDGEARPFPAGAAYDVGADEFVDTDGDTLPDWWEALHSTDANADDDGDGLLGWQEYNEGTDPADPDTDGDGRSDGEEIAAGTHPLHPDNIDGIYYVNGAEGNDSYDGLSPVWDGTHGPKATIQAGIDATLDGWDHTVLVADGLYTGPGNHDVRIDAKSITLRSEHGSEYAIVDCGGTHQGIVITCGQSRTCVLEGFTVTNGSAETGGGVYARLGSLTMTDCVLTRNWAQDKGGGLVCDYCDVTLNHCEFRSNEAMNGGGGGCFALCDVTASECIFDRNTARDSGSDGGAISYYGDSLVLTDSVLSRNSAGRSGGALRLSGGVIRIEACVLSANTAGEGGAVFTRNENSLTVVGCVIERNMAYDLGGGVYCDEACTLEITDTTLEMNSARHGGAIYCPYEGTVTVVRSIIASNTTSSHGAGVYSEHIDPTFTDCIFQGNITEYDGGAFYVSYSSPTITNCTFTENSAANGGAMYTYHNSSLPTFTNCILWANSPDQIHVSSGTPTLAYCDVQGGWTGTANIDVDPLLTPNGHLSSGSPCIDYCLTGSDSDVDGQSRPLDMAGVGFDGTRTYDIGADEFFDTDLDGMDDDWESAHGLDPLDPSDAYGDLDGDGLINVDEYTCGTDPCNPDTDGDGRTDGDEHANGTNPLHEDNAEKTFYVDGAAGNDRHDGLTPQWDGTHGPRATIQAGIDAALPGWGYIVCVADGTYTGAGNTNLDFEGKDITVRSASGSASCVIDCGGDDRAFWFHSGETTTSIIEGFTIANGYTDHWPNSGGILLEDSGATIRECSIRNCTSEYGGAIYCRGGDLVIARCVISDNVATRMVGAGIFAWEGNLVLTNSIVVSNGPPESTTQVGAGLLADDLTSLTIASCTFAANHGGSGAAVFAGDLGTCSITNTVFWDNGDDPIYGISVPMQYCLAQYGTGMPWFDSATCLDADPELTSDWHIGAASPCVDWCPTGPAADIDGDPRPLDVIGVGYSEPRTFDIGADEVMDTDGDGIDDDWEIEHGLDPLNPQDATQDADGDWLLNAEEFDFGSDPQDPHSPAFVYVDDDAAGAPVQDGTAANPYATIQAGVDAAALAAPAVVKVLPGMYAEFVTMADHVWVVGSGPDSTTIAPPAAGPAVFLDEVENALLAGFTFAADTTSPQIRSWDSYVTVRNCVLANARNAAGVNYTGSIRFINCLLADNVQYGLWVSGTVAVEMTNCTVANNGECGAGFYGSNGARLVNTIFCDNGDDLDIGTSASVTAAYCVIGDGDFAGSNGNLWAYPWFVNAATGDYHLQATSPCIDAGTSDGAHSLDLGAMPRWDATPIPNTGGGLLPYYDIGAYEFFPGDLNGDGAITVDDLVIVYGGLRGDDPALDLDGDGIVTFADLRILYEHIPEAERDLGGVSTLWALDYMTPTDPDVEGLDPTQDQSQLDNDGDARTNYQEFIAGTDPTDPTSLFEVTGVTSSISPDGEVFAVTWSVVAGKHYQLYASETLGPGADWQPVFGEQIIDSGIATQTVLVDSEITQLFFRVEVW